MGKGSVINRVMMPMSIVSGVHPCNAYVDHAQQFVTGLGLAQGASTVTRQAGGGGKLEDAIDLHSGQRFVLLFGFLF